MARRDVSEARKGTYYLGTALLVVGGLLFISVFFSAFGHSPSVHEGIPSFMLRGPVGMAMMIAGSLLQRVGARGAAGSGLILDPQRAREDLEPWSRMGGGVVSDALDEAGIDLGRAGAAAASSGDEWAGLPLDERLRRLHGLHADGILTDDEYAREKRELLDSNN